jgi:hypothetical protein
LTGTSPKMNCRAALPISAGLFSGKKIYRT